MLLATPIHGELILLLTHRAVEEIWLEAARGRRLLRLGWLLLHTTAKWELLGRLLLSGHTIHVRGGAVVFRHGFKGGILDTRRVHVRVVRHHAQKLVDLLLSLILLIVLLLLRLHWLSLHLLASRRWLSDKVREAIVLLLRSSHWSRRDEVTKCVVLLGRWLCHRHADQVNRGLLNGCGWCLSSGCH